MIKEKEKYRAQYFQIGAFSCMAPFGKVILDIKDMTPRNLNISLLIHFVLSLFLFYIGVKLLYRGFKILEIGEK